MVVPAGPSRDRHEAATWLLRWPGAFSRVLGGRASRRRSAKHGGEDRAEHFAGANSRRRSDWHEHGFIDRVRSFVATVVAAVAQLYPSGGEALAR